MKYQNNLSIPSLVAMATLYIGSFMGSAAASAFINDDGSNRKYIYGAPVLIGALLVLISSVAMFLKMKWSRIISSIGLHIIFVVFSVALLIDFKFSVGNTISWLALMLPNIIMILVLHNKNIELFPNKTDLPDSGKASPES